MYRIVVLFLFVTAMSAEKAIACMVPPDHMYLNHDATIEHADWIAIAQPIRRIHNDDGTALEMRAIEYLKGNGPEKFVVPNAHQGAANHHSKLSAEGNFYAHTASTFWELGGSYSNWSD